MPRRPPRLTRTHATALLLPAPAGEPDRTVLVLTDDATLGYATPEAVLTGGTGRGVLTRAELLDAEIHVVPGSGGRLAPGCAARLDEMLDYLNTWLTDELAPPSAPGRPGASTAQDTRS
ncbi:hypothetical protein ACIBIZ_52115 [Nonomuraea spiralis]|uniref:hypothetical protein n=1 Tax=Nonomuraea spiralis TaxID=46182 RepID=UPI0037B844E6